MEIMSLVILPNLNKQRYNKILLTEG
jgi:hypothetical protein